MMMRQESYRLQVGGSHKYAFEIRPHTDKITLFKKTFEKNQDKIDGFLPLLPALLPVHTGRELPARPYKWVSSELL